MIKKKCIIRISCINNKIKYRLNVEIIWGQINLYQTNESVNLCHFGRERSEKEVSSLRHTSVNIYMNASEELGT